MSEERIYGNDGFKHSDRLISLCLKAGKYAQEDPEVSLTQARKAAEAICLHVFAKEIGEPGNLLLNDLIRHLGGKKFIPRRLQLPLTTIQSYGNYGSHHQNDCVELDSEFVEPCLAALKQVLIWFFQHYLATDFPEELKGFIGQSNKQNSGAKVLTHPAFSRNTQITHPTNTILDVSTIADKSVGESYSHLPVEELLPIFGDKNTLTLNCPCDLITTFKANQMTMAFYGSEVISFEKYEQWWSKNPRILACLTASNGEVQGYFDIFPLKDAFLEKFIEGDLTEDALTSDDILAPSESLFCCQLYLGGIAVKSPNTFVGSRNAAILLWGILKYLKSFYPGNRARMLYALGSTAEGESLLKKFNFTLSSPADKRSDGHNLYALPFTPLLLDSYLSLIQDWSGNCEIVWNKDDTNIIKSLAS